ncbi:VOC family protein [Streptomyces iakyrus]|uniref:VOC family protein n=1 Tax=Streptomyces iakyrus TaxID=68219 RepID=UPI0036A720ED
MPSPTSGGTSWTARSAGSEPARETARAVAEGARLAGFQPQDDVRVLLDPAGHPFCLSTETPQ